MVPPRIGEANQPPTGVSVEGLQGLRCNISAGLPISPGETSPYPCPPITNGLKTPDIGVIEGSSPPFDVEEGRGTHTPAGQVLQDLYWVGVPAEGGNHHHHYPKTRKIYETCGAGLDNVGVQDYPCISGMVNLDPLPKGNADNQVMGLL